MTSASALDQLPDGSVVIVPATTVHVFAKHDGAWYIPWDGDDHVVPSSAIVTAARRAGVRVVIPTPLSVVNEEADLAGLRSGAILHAHPYLHEWTGEVVYDLAGGPSLTAAEYAAAFPGAHVVWESGSSDVSE